MVTHKQTVEIGVTRSPGALNHIAGALTRVIDPVVRTDGNAYAHDASAKVIYRLVNRDPSVTRSHSLPERRRRIHLMGKQLTIIKKKILHEYRVAILLGVGQQAG